MRTASAGDLRLRGGVDDLESGGGGAPPPLLPGGRKPSTAGRATTYPPLIAAAARVLAEADPNAVRGGAAVAALLLLWLASRAGGAAVFALLAVSAALAYAAHLAAWVLAKDEGTPDMAAVSDAIREGAEGFFGTQYTAIARLAALCAAGIYVVYAFRRETKEQEAAGLSRATLAFVTAASFLLGCACSGAAGFIGMWVSVRANVRVAGAARRSPREALAVALRAGGASALLVVCMVVFGLTTLYALLTALYGGGAPDAHGAHRGGLAPADVPLLLVGFGFGASFVALFAQLGGGIYTKAADVGADLVGKIEAGIPEDDPRNPAVIADLVGDNVGDCAARGADLFESIAAEIIAAMILGGTLAKQAGLAAAAPRFIAFPLVVHACDVLVTAAGIASVDPAAPARAGGEDPYDVLKGGYKVSLGLAIAAFVASCRFLLHAPSAPAAWLHFAGAGLVGAATSVAFVFIAQYYTDYKFQPVQDVAAACRTGHATNVIAGLSLGLESTAAPVCVMAAALCAAYWLGTTSGLTPGSSADGLFGTAVATMGMLSTAAYVLACDIFGPISDNAGGIVEMSDQPDSVRAITDALDAVGNTTKATTKGYAIGSAGLASFLLFSAFNDEVAAFTGAPFRVVDIAIPEVFAAGLLGAMVVFLFAAWACAAVGRSAAAVVGEVRRQLAERPGIMTHAEKPDYARCVAIVASSALREMVKPGALVVLAPIVVGLVFRVAGAATGQPLLGAQAVAAFMMLATVSGVILALTLNNAGGAFDNAKKFVETGAHGGKGSAAHAAAVTGDTVGDPLKDTAGPSLHVLIKLVATISLVACPLFL